MDTAEKLAESAIAVLKNTCEAFDHFVLKPWKRIGWHEEVPRGRQLGSDWRPFRDTFRDLKEIWYGNGEKK